ncbi:hypothetical protein niasHS_014026 [Heterodera schachtii]|uniref:Uncharacterized protein n=1 Tax=Heterodera schachtii TaxID=97005 RepID=A0ABD2IHX3_HETSC
MAERSNRRIPPELVKELVGALPFHIRWATDRICASFDLFILRTQFVWVKKELIRQNVLREKRRQLESDQARLIQAAAGFPNQLLFSIIKMIASYFRVPENYGLQNVGEELTREMFVQQLNAMLATLVNYEDENELYWRARFLASITNFLEREGKRA